MKLKRPDRCPGKLFLYQARQGSAYLDCLSDLGWNSGEFLEAVRTALWVDYVRAKKSSAAVEFEIEITARRLRFYKELDAAIFPNLIKVIRSDAADILILNFEYSVNPRGII